MDITIIVAIAKNNAIGKNNDLLWHLPTDMKFFKETTEGHCIITGRKNYFSIPKKFRPLKNRTNIIVTRDKNLSINEDIIISHSIEDAIEKAKKIEKKEIFIIGGGEIYKQSLKYANKLYITEVDTIFEDADTFFPEINKVDYKIELISEHKKDEKHKFDFQIKLYSKV